jgi:hypothetical protein
METVQQEVIFDYGGNPHLATTPGPPPMLPQRSYIAPPPGPPPQYVTDYGTEQELACLVDTPSRTPRCDGGIILNSSAGLRDC